MNSNGNQKQEKERDSISVELQQAFTEISNRLKGRSAFPEKIERAKNMFQDLKALPI